MLPNGATPPPPTTKAATSSGDTNRAPTADRPALRCPRCDSTNTKFCYYNNYSLTQPRHFCKSCRRYWTHGGALRNVPIGGASRKSKKPRRPSLPAPPPLISSTFPRFNMNPPPPPPPPNFLGLGNYPIISTAIQGGGGSGGGGGDGFLASSIESLSSLNQELHWKLQQQRMSLFLDEAAPAEAVSVAAASNCHVIKKPQPIFFQNLEATNSFSHQHSSAGTHIDQTNTSSNNNQFFFDTSYSGGGSGSGYRNSCDNRNENTDNENGANKLNDSGGYVLDKDGMIKFQCSQFLGMKKI